VFNARLVQIVPSVIGVGFWRSVLAGNVRLYFRIVMSVMIARSVFNVLRVTWLLYLAVKSVTHL